MRTQDLLRRVLSDFTPVSIKMAKEQNLSLNPTKISGQCGRLMCCLKYEQDFYEETLKKLPRVGKDIMTPDGAGTVTEISAIKEKVRVRVKNGDDFEIREYAIEDVRRLQPGEKGIRAEQSAPVQEEAAETNEEEPIAEEIAAEPGEKSSRKSYPRPKKRKTMNTDEYMARNASEKAE